MIHYGDILRPAWHESATVRRILGRFSADGFPAVRAVTRQGIWCDASAPEYDRSHPGVAALIAVRAVWFELVGDTGDTSADALICSHERRHAWERSFCAAVSAMRLDFPPWGNALSRAAGAGDLDDCPVAAAQRFVARWEQDRQESVQRFHAERTGCGQAVMEAVR